MKQEIRIVLVGESGVGKSTLVTTLIKDSFVSQVQPLVPEVTIPPEATPEKVTTHIIDTGIILKKFALIYFSLL
ncbi:ERMES complex Ca(2+)-binding regulatory GTPase gem1 [Entomophthora muscae]|uniref:ERMES complex Ca(2+)-binding regulatory GTPase gem1 n=1 Tax=Entomophthora muscae TaxID=34485 RepID=A0ACC2S3X8_9FUNG|nr:ERMES complex Ca(2+)-binding regulatory GTPase gem1 [Entomophthora muscae]